jgi:DNA-binding transcriptional LysR family regulator
MEGSDIETQLGLVSAGVGISLQPSSHGSAARAWRGDNSQPTRQPPPPSNSPGASPPGRH